MIINSECNCLDGKYFGWELIRFELIQMRVNWMRIKQLGVDLDGN